MILLPLAVLELDIRAIFSFLFRLLLALLFSLLLISSVFFLSEGTSISSLSLSTYSPLHLPLLLILHPAFVLSSTFESSGRDKRKSLA